MTTKKNYEIDENSWKKLSNTAEKAGYRDGISKGRELNFQKSFDVGYREGFKNGFALSLYKGAISNAGTEYDHRLKDEELKKVSRGNCNICKNKELENEITSKIICLQTEDTNKLLSKLYDKYKIQINLPNKLT